MTYPSSVRQVISAQQLPKVNKKKSSIVDPLVKVNVYGAPADCAERETNHIENNGTFLVMHIDFHLLEVWLCDIFQVPLGPYINELSSIHLLLLIQCWVAGPTA